MNNAYVYQHIRLDTNEVFYIGIGTMREGRSNDYQRANRITKRSTFWDKVYKKASRKVEILFDRISIEEAKVKEIELIKFHGKRINKNGTLVNLSDGGEGAFGMKISQWHKDIISKAQKGKKRTPEEIENNRIKHLGLICSEETKAKMRIISTGKRHSQETKDMIRLQRTGVKRPLEVIEKMRATSKGKKKSIESTIKKQRPVINLETGIYYDSVGEAAFSIELSISKLSNRLKGWAKNNTSMAYAG